MLPAPELNQLVTTAANACKGAESGDAAEVGWCAQEAILVHAGRRACEHVHECKHENGRMGAGVNTDMHSKAHSKCIFS